MRRAVAAVGVITAMMTGLTACGGSSSSTKAVSQSAKTSNGGASQSSQPTSAASATNSPDSSQGADAAFLPVPSSDERMDLSKAKDPQSIVRLCDMLVGTPPQFAKAMGVTLPGLKSSWQTGVHLSDPSANITKLPDALTPYSMSLTCNLGREDSTGYQGGLTYDMLVDDLGRPVTRENALEVPSDTGIVAESTTDVAVASGTRLDGSNRAQVKAVVEKAAKIVVGKQ